MKEQERQREEAEKRSSATQVSVLNTRILRKVSFEGRRMSYERISNRPSSSSQYGLDVGINNS